MRIYNQPVELILEQPSAAVQSKSLPGLKKQLTDAGIPVEEVTYADENIPKQVRAKAGKALAAKAAPVSRKAFIKTKLKDSEINPWDVAHLSAKALGVQTTFAEPDILQEFVIDRNLDVPYKKSKLSAKTDKTSNDGFDPDWKPRKNIIWHLDEAFSQLKLAREAVDGIDFTVRIGHLDTGYSKTHFAIPDHIRINSLQRNFVEGEPQNDAHDPLVDGNLRQPGHGTGTLGILAGGKINLKTDNGVFHDFLGGAPFAEVVCCRIASSVILMKTSAFAQAINYLTQLTLSGTPVHIVSMSMGGAPAKSWADAVNAAYDAGITLVTAAGNNFAGLPTRHVVYPARFRRVVAACGVTYEYAPYSISKLDEMQGCFGPERHMSKALAAFTPNTPWATVDAKKGVIRFSGAGTSSATPQIAAAAACYYRQHHQKLEALEPWMRVEAIRNALYKSALKNSPAVNGSFKKYFGNGILQAHAALKVAVPSSFTKTPEDSVPWFPILNTLFKSVPRTVSRKLEMYNTELAQLVYYYPELSVLIDDEQKDYSKVGEKKWKQFTDAVVAHPASSIALKNHLMQTHRG